MLWYLCRGVMRSGEGLGGNFAMSRGQVLCAEACWLARLENEGCARRAPSLWEGLALVWRGGKLPHKPERNRYVYRAAVALLLLARRMYLWLSD